MNPAAIDVAHEIHRFEWKVDAGAEFAVTQPVFDPVQLERFLAAVAHVRIPVIAGIWPLVSVRNAEFLANEVPGVRVPENLLDRMRRADGPDAAAAEGIAIARDIASSLRASVQGIQVATQSGNVDAALAVLDGLR